MRGRRAVSIDEMFEKLVGRPASAQERDRLQRLREVLGLRDNDAFWAIVMALEHYDSFFRKYPSELAEATDRALDKVRASYALAAKQELALAHRALTQGAAETSASRARGVAERPGALLPSHPGAWRRRCLRSAVRARGIRAGLERAAVLDRTG